MRIKVSYRSSSREVFKRFCQKHPEVVIDYNEWCSIIYGFNYAFRDYLFETGKVGKFPYGFGKFVVMKYKPPKSKIIDTYKGSTEIVTLPVDWKKSKELGRRVYHLNYHTEGFRFKLKWFVPTASFSNAIVWCFKPSRITSRLLKHYLTIPGNQYKYQEWKKV